MPVKTYSGPPVTLVRVPKQAKQCNHLLRRRFTRSHSARVPIAAQQVLAAAGMDQKASQDACLCDTPSSFSLDRLQCCRAAPIAPLPALRKIPSSLSEIDNGKILGFGTDLAADHPVSCSFTAFSARL